MVMSLILIHTCFQEIKHVVLFNMPSGGYTHKSEGSRTDSNAVHSKRLPCFVLYYSVALTNIHNPFLMSRGHVYHQENAEQWNIDKDKVAICGFSAGAHLAASLGVHYNKPYLKTGHSFR